MTERAVGLRSQLIIWAAAEARRLRRRTAPVHSAVARPAVSLVVDSKIQGVLRFGEVSA